MKRINKYLAMLIAMIMMFSVMTMQAIAEYRFDETDIGLYEEIYEEDHEDTDRIFDEESESRNVDDDDDRDDISDERGVLITDITLTQNSQSATANISAGTSGRVPITVTAPSTGNVTISIVPGGTSDANDPALYNAGGTRIAYQNASSYGFTYTINAGTTFSGFVGTGGNVARTYTITSTGWTTAALYTTNPPPQRTSSNATINSITVNATTAPTGWTTQYRIRVGSTGAWGAWQNSNVFTGLVATTMYQIQTRFTANNTATHAHSAESPVSWDITTSSESLSVGGLTGWNPSSAAGSNSVSVSSNVSWTASSSATSWLTVSPASGFQNGTVRLNVTANTGAFSRSGTITLMGGGISRTITVTQAASVSTTNAPAQRVVSSTNANSITVNATTAPTGWTTQYRIRVGSTNDPTIPTLVWGEWQNSNTFTGLSDGRLYQFQARFTANNTATHAHSAESVVSANMTPAPRQPTVSSTTTNSITVHSIPVPGTGWLTYYLLRNTSGTVVSSWQTGTTFTGLAAGTYQVQAVFWAQNSAGSNPSDSANSMSILSSNITIAAAANLTIGSTTWNPASAAGNASVSVTSNVSWTASSNATSWLTVSPASGSNNGTIMLNATANTGTSSRTGTITVTGGGLTRTITVTQAVPVTTNAPAQRVASSTTANSITVNATTAPTGWTTQYRIRVGSTGTWGAWQNSNTFTGLAAGTIHQVQARFTANNTATHAHSAESAVSANISTAAGFPSERNLGHNLNTTLTYTHPTAAVSLDVTFSNDTHFENNYDFLEILDANNTRIGRYTNNQLSGKTINVPGNVVKFRVITDGSVSSAGYTVTNIVAVNTTLPIPSFVVRRDDYSFINTSSSFGYHNNYKIPLDRYTALFGATKGTQLYSSRGVWGGSCYGFSASTLEFFMKELTPSTYHSTAASVFDIPAPRNPSHPTTQLIETYQISWFLDAMWASNSFNKNSYTRLIQALQPSNRSKNGIVALSVYNKDSGHAVVAYDITETASEYVISYYNNWYAGITDYLYINKNKHSMRFSDYSMERYYGSANGLTDFYFVTSSDVRNSMPGSSRGSGDGTLVTVSAKDVVVLDAFNNPVPESYIIPPAPGSTSDQVLFHLPDGEYSIKSARNAFSVVGEQFVVSISDNENYIRLSSGSSDFDVTFKLGVTPTLQLTNVDSAIDGQIISTNPGLNVESLSLVRVLPEAYELSFFDPSASRNQDDVTITDAPRSVGENDAKEMSFRID